MPASRWRRPHCARRTRKSAWSRPRSKCSAGSPRFRYYVSGHLLHPVVGFASERPNFTLASHEVERLIEVPVALLREPERVLWEERTRILPPRGVMNVPYFDVLDTRVWGATAMVLAEFVALVEELEKSV